MCVFDHQQDRLAGRQAIKDPAHYLDHLPLTRCPVRVRHKVQPRKQHRECRAAAQDLAAPLLIRLSPEGTQGFHDRPERQRALTDVQAAAGQDPEPQTRGGAGHVLYQPSLADTGVAPHGDQHHFAARGTYPADRLGPPDGAGAGQAEAGGGRRGCRAGSPCQASGY